MPNIKSAKKRVVTSKARAERNSTVKSSLRTEIKKCREAVAANKTETLQDSYKNAAVALDKAVTKNILHKNTAARKKSRLAKAVNAASKQ